MTSIPRYIVSMIVMGFGVLCFLFQTLNNYCFLFYICKEVENKNTTLSKLKKKIIKYLRHVVFYILRMTVNGGSTAVCCKPEMIGGN